MEYFLIDSNEDFFETIYKRSQYLDCELSSSKSCILSDSASLPSSHTGRLSVEEEAEILNIFNIKVVQQPKINIKSDRKMLNDLNYLLVI